MTCALTVASGLWPADLRLAKEWSLTGEATAVGDAESLQSFARYGMAPQRRGSSSNPAPGTPAPGAQSSTGLAALSEETWAAASTPHPAEGGLASGASGGQALEDGAAPEPRAKRAARPKPEKVNVPTPSDELPAEGINGPTIGKSWCLPQLCVWALTALGGICMYM